MAIDIIPSFSRVFIGPNYETQLTVDPEPYEPADWPKRFSIQKGLQGASVVQDFGTYAGDLTVTLRHETMDNGIIRALDGYYRTRGATFKLKDWLLNEFVVFIARFKWTPDVHLDKSGYEMTCNVVSITKLFGEVYTGP